MSRTIIDNIYDETKNYNVEPDTMREWVNQIELIDRLMGTGGKTKESPLTVLKDPNNKKLIEDIKKDYIEDNVNGQYTEYIESLQQLEEIN